MRIEDHTTRSRDARLQLLAAELTSAAYPLVLWRGTEGSWVRMQLGLWKALAETIAEWARRPRPVEPDSNLRSRYEGFLGAVTESALVVAKENGVNASCPDVKSSLYEAFRQVMRRYSHVS